MFIKGWYINELQLKGIIKFILWYWKNIRKLIFFMDLKLIFIMNLYWNNFLLSFPGHLWTSYSPYSTECSPILPSLSSTRGRGMDSQNFIATIPSYLLLLSLMSCSFCSLILNLNEFDSIFDPIHHQFHRFIRPCYHWEIAFHFFQFPPLLPHDEASFGRHWWHFSWTSLLFQ